MGIDVSDRLVISRNRGACSASGHRRGVHPRRRSARTKPGWRRPWRGGRRGDGSYRRDREAGPRAAEEADQLKEDFIATVSHELRTPLTSIKGYARTLISRQSELTEEETNTFLEVMVRQCDRLAQIIDTLLLVSRLEAGEIEGKRTYIGLADLLRDAAEASSDEDRFEIDVRGPVGLTTDHFRVFHIVRNLMENACKYSPSSTAVRVTAARNEDHFEISVEDQGPGIPEGQRADDLRPVQPVAGPAGAQPCRGQGWVSTSHAGSPATWAGTSRSPRARGGRGRGPDSSFGCPPASSRSRRVPKSYGTLDRLAAS